MRVYSLKILSLQIMEFYHEYYFCIFKFTRAYVSVKIQKYGFLMKIDTENCSLLYHTNRIFPFKFYLGGNK